MGVVVNFDYRRVRGAARVVLSTGNLDYYEDGDGDDYKDVLGGGDDDCMARVWMEFCLFFTGRW